MSAGDILLLALVVGYLLVFVPPATRRIEFESSVVAKCTPMKAFALVSDPNNWQRYVPELSLRSRVTAPVKLGDLIEDRVVWQVLAHDSVERVIAFEPGERFGTQIVGGHHTTGEYEFFATDGGTLITYRCRATLTLLEAWAGNGFRRGHLAARLKAVRDQIMDRIRNLLEGEPSQVSV